jgi:type IV pilus assembly protein PilO
MQLSSGKNSGPLLVTALVLALLFAVYYYIVLPKQDEAETKQSTVDSLNSEISTMKEQIALIEEGNNDAADNEFTIRKKLPESREIDQLLLSLEEIEYISNSRIVGVSFNNYDDLVSASGLADPNAAAEENPVDETTDESASEAVDQQEETIPVSTMSAEALPANLKLITFQIDIESPDDEQLQQFIEEIEGLERIMHIDTIEYSLPGEEDAFTDEASTIVSASIQVTTFYFE